VSGLKLLFLNKIYGHEYVIGGDHLSMGYFDNGFLNRYEKDLIFFL
jgi:hypothetical protein